MRTDSDGSGSSFGYSVIKTYRLPSFIKWANEVATRLFVLSCKVFAFRIIPSF